MQIELNISLFRCKYDEMKILSAFHSVKIGFVSFKMYLKFKSNGEDMLIRRKAECFLNV